MSDEIDYLVVWGIRDTKSGDQVHLSEIVRSSFEEKSSKIEKFTDEINPKDFGFDSGSWVMVKGVFENHTVPSEAASL